jgi:predicted tellurium resistance membrane protein TerC
MDFSHLLTTEALVSFLVLVVLEVVLGIDNVIFVSIIINRLPDNKEKSARRFWMISGMIVRSILLMCLGWLLAQKGNALFTIAGKSFDLASLIMLAGGLFLIVKTIKEIHHKLEGADENAGGANKASLTFSQAAMQILLIDMVFSFDSIITAGGTAEHVEIMIAAVVIAMACMFFFAPKIASYIQKHPTVKMLAMSFLVMIGLSLIVEGWDAEKAHELHLKNYIYFAMAFSFIVEMLNITFAKKSANKKIVALNEPHIDEIKEKDSDMAH